MGMPGCNFSSSSYSEKKSINLPNPNPNNYRIIMMKEIGTYLLLKIRYLDCTNYEGVKIMVYKDCNLFKILQQKRIDPHFCENKEFHSPIARFEPTEEGWNLATDFINMLRGVKC